MDENNNNNNNNNEIKAPEIIQPKLEAECGKKSPQNLYLCEEDKLTTQDAVYLYFVNESNMENCPQIKILIVNQICTALINTGCQCSAMSEKLYNNLKTKGLIFFGNASTEHYFAKCIFSKKKGQSTTTSTD
jgi:hypothetical protein